MAELILLGSGTGIPSIKRSSPGLVIISGQTRMMVDSGPGTLRKMLEAGLTYRDVDLILYTHLHPDHTSDLVPTLFACNYGDLPRKKDLSCVGGPGFKSFFGGLQKLYGPWIEPQLYHLTVKEFSREPVLCQDVRISAKPMAHIPGSVGYRVEFMDGKSIALSGDTDYCQNIIDLGFEVDLLVLECSFPDEKKTEGHLTPSLAGRIGSESHCKKLLLTHLYPVCDKVDILEQCRRVYRGEVLLGEDLMRIII